MKGFTPDLFDRLLGQPQRNGVAVARLNVEELKDAVARDLEALLNTRSTIQDGALAAFPECVRSMVGYGLCDFADRSLSSPADRAHICACIENTIARHEPRLQNVKALLEMQGDGGAPSVNRLSFSITAVLMGSMSQEPVNFDAVLQPSTLQYSIRKAGRAGSANAAGAAASPSAAGA
ncbi:type VI secretion system protein ImpF [Massilia sp. UYP11]|uniref:type VI secretion system baseplate subunit TssE n=1 Tax=Massilia sp. UYP11 TaxID=1756385 RepID=UPI003D1D31D6